MLKRRFVTVSAAGNKIQKGMRVLYSKLKKEDSPGFTCSLLIVALIAGILIIGLSFDVPVGILLLINTAVLTVSSLMLGVSYDRIEQGILKGVKRAINCVLILVLVGTLIATWIQCGTVPMLVYYGLGILDVKTILPVTCLLCAMLSVCIGTSWGTTGTIGIACVSVGVSMGIPVEICAGAAVSGAIFGDKISPVSDTTILASSTSEINLYSHIRAMLKNVIPTLALSTAAYYFVGVRYAGNAMDTSLVQEVRTTLGDQFHFSPLLLLPLLLIVCMSITKKPAFPTIFLSALLGSLLSVLIQKNNLADALTVMNTGFISDTGSTIVDTMLTKGGISSMMSTIIVAVLALAMGGVLDEVGYMRAIVQRLIPHLKSDRSTVLATVGIGIGLTLLCSNYFVVMVLLGSLFRQVYDDRDIHRSILSRSMEDAITPTIAIIPWNTSCIYYTELFGLTSQTWAFYAFFCWGNVLFSVGATILGFFIRKAASEEEKLPNAL